MGKLEGDNKRPTGNSIKPSIDGIFTIGYGNRGIVEFQKVLTNADIKVLIDVRRKGSRAWSPLYAQGYRCFADRMLRIRPHDKAIWYIPASEFGNTSSSLSTFGNWLRSEEFAQVVDAWVSIFDAYMHLGYNPCLMCAELEAYKDDVVNCHRVLVAEYLKERLLHLTGYTYDIIHL